MIIAELLTLARLKHLYYVNSATWDSTSLKKVICPAGKRWFLCYGVVYRSDNADLNVYIYDSTDQVASILSYLAAGTGYCAVPISSANFLNPGDLICLDAGDYFKFAFGAAQGATAVVGVTVFEIDML